jgi:DNA-binding PadR family transcriptional regulator
MNKEQTLSGKESIVLDLLAERGELYGLELVEASEGRLKRGTVYVTLGRMEDKGYVESWQEERHPGAIGLPRRLYRATPLGLRVRDAWAMLRQRLAFEGSR